MDRKAALEIVGSKKKSAIKKTLEKTENNKNNNKKKIQPEDMELVKKKAVEEINKMHEIIETAYSEMNKLALFEDDSEMIKIIFEKMMLEDFVEPIIKGFKVPYMSDEDFKAIRKDMFIKLLKKYVL